MGTRLPMAPKAALALAWRRDLAVCAAVPEDAEPKALWAMLKAAWSAGDQSAFLAATRALRAQGAVRPPYALKMARALLDAGAPGEAAELLLAAPPADPPDDPTHALMLAQGLRGVGRDAEARAAFDAASALGLAAQSPELAPRLQHALELERRAPDLDGWPEWGALVCDYLQWGLADRATDALTAFFARSHDVGDDDLEAALDFAISAFRVGSPAKAMPLLAAMEGLFRREGCGEDFDEVVHALGAPGDVVLPGDRHRPPSRFGRKLLRALGGACASQGRWRMAAWRFGELAPSRRSADVRPELARCIGRQLLADAPLALAPPGPRRRVFDLFPYNGESMVLSIKLHEMAPWVDRFVIVEARASFTGEPKPLCFEAQRPMFAAFADKISYVVVDAFPDGLNSAWSREFFQRDSAVRGLQGLAAPEDIVLLTDVDEIVDRRALEGFEAEILPVRLRFFQYFLNCEYVFRTPTAQTLALKARLLARNGSSYLRLWVRDRVRGEGLEDAGWHFSSVADPETIGRKMRSFSHQEHAHLDGAHFERLMGAIRGGEKPEAYARREIDDSFPAYVRANREALAAYLL